MWYIKDIAILIIEDNVSVTELYCLSKEGEGGLVQGSVGEGEMIPVFWGRWSDSFLAFDQAADNPTSQKHQESPDQNTEGTRRNTRAWLILFPEQVEVEPLTGFRID